MASELLNPYLQHRRQRSPWDPTIGPESPGGGVPPIPQPRPASQPETSRQPIDTQNPGLSESERYFTAMQAARANRPLTDRYQGMLEAPPNEGDYKASKWRGLGAGVVGVAHAYNGDLKTGMEESDRFIRAPYTNAMGRYNDELGRAKIGAGIEQQDIQDTMGVMKDAAGLGLDYNKYLETVRNNKEDHQLGVDTLEHQKAKLLAEGWKEDYDLDGSIIYTNPLTKESKRFEGTNTVQSVNAATGIKNADANMMGARTGQGRLAMDQAQGDRRLDQGDIKLGLEQADLKLKSDRALRATPQEQSTAYMQAMRELQADPILGKAVEFNPQTGDLYILKKDMTQEQFNAIQAELETRVTEILDTAGSESRRSPIGKPPDPDPDLTERVRGLGQFMQQRQEERNKWFRIPTRDYNQGGGQ